MSNAARCVRTHASPTTRGNRHCPKCQGAAAKEWLADRQAELLPVPYHHVVFTMPAPIADIAYYNKAVIYGILFKAAAETLITIAADPKRLGARIGLTAVLHSWGSALTHHPHVHIIVPGGGFSPDGQHWIACRPSFFLSVRVLSRLFRRLFLEKLTAALGPVILPFESHAFAVEGESTIGKGDPVGVTGQVGEHRIRPAEWLLGIHHPFDVSQCGEAGFEGCWLGQGRLVGEERQPPGLIGGMIIVETFGPGCQPQLWPIPAIGLDSS